MIKVEQYVPVENVVLGLSSLSTGPLSMRRWTIDIPSPVSPDDGCFAFLDERAGRSFSELYRGKNSTVAI
jgi:hypothetical protein